MPDALDISDSTVVIRPRGSFVLFCLSVLMAFWPGMLCWLVIRDRVAEPADWLLPMGISALIFVGLCFLMERRPVITIDGAKDLVLIERRAVPGLPAKTDRYTLSDFAGVTSYATWGSGGERCKVVLVTMDLRSLLISSEDSRFVAKSFLSVPKAVETAHARQLKAAIVRISGLKDFGYREQHPPYRPIEV